MAHPQDQLSYRVYYRPVSNETHTDLNSSLEHTETDLLTITLDQLEPDTEYEISVTALTKKVTCTEHVKSDQLCLSSGIDWWWRVRGVNCCRPGLRL